MAESDGKKEAVPKNLVSTQGRGTEICQKTIITSADNIKAGPGKLYYLMVTNANSSRRNFSLHDATSGAAAGDLVQKFFMAAESSQVFTFDPPMPFAVGIRIGAIEHSEITMVGGYV